MTKWGFALLHRHSLKLNGQIFKGFRAGSCATLRDAMVSESSAHSPRTHNNNEFAADLSLRAQRSQAPSAFSNFFTALYDHRLFCPQPFCCTAEAPGEECSPFHHGASTARAIHRLSGCCRRWNDCYRCQGRSASGSEGSPGDRRTWRLDYSWLHLGPQPSLAGGVSWNCCRQHPDWLDRRSLLAKGNQGSP